MEYGPGSGLKCIKYMHYFSRESSIVYIMVACDTFSIYNEEGHFSFTSNLFIYKNFVTGLVLLCVQSAWMSKRK